MKYYVRESATSRIHGTFTVEELAAKVSNGELTAASLVHVSQGQTEGALMRSGQWTPLKSLVGQQTAADPRQAADDVEAVADDTAETRCPACSELILKTAKKCKHCDEWIVTVKHSAQSPGTDAITCVTTLTRVGIVMLIVGLAWALNAMSTDTSVSTGEYGQRINNIGLMNDKQNHVIVGGIIAVIGAGLLAAGTVAGASSKRA